MRSRCVCEEEIKATLCLPGLEHEQQIPFHSKKSSAWRPNQTYPESHVYVATSGLINGLLTAGQTIMSTTALLLVSLFVFACMAVELIAKEGNMAIKRL